MRMEAVAPGRSHVQQTLHQLERVARHRVKEELKEAEATPEQRREFREMSKEFSVALRDAFLDAGRGNRFSRALAVEGAGAAMAAYAERLRAYLGEPVEEPAVVDPDSDPVAGAEPGTTPAGADGAAPADAIPALDVRA